MIRLSTKWWLVAVTFLLVLLLAVIVLLNRHHIGYERIPASANLPASPVESPALLYSPYLGNVSIVITDIGEQFIPFTIKNETAHLIDVIPPSRLESFNGYGWYVVSHIQYRPTVALTYTMQPHSYTDIFQLNLADFPPITEGGLYRIRVETAMIYQRRQRHSLIAEFYG